MKRFSPLTDPVWQAIKREAAAASEHIAIGVTALSYANYAYPARYTQAFFALSTGFERSVKLALLIDHAEQNNGKFLTYEELFKLGHKLNILFGLADSLANRLGSSRLDPTGFQQGIIDVLTLFATNRTRSYNLEFLTGRKETRQEKEPMAHWHRAVVEPILAEYYSEKHRSRDERRAQTIEHLMGPSAIVMQTAEDGSEIGDLYTGSMQTAKSDFTRPYVRLSVLQLARFLSCIFSKLTTRSYELRMEFIPHLSEFYGIFDSSDSYLKRRKCWSNYRP